MALAINVVAVFLAFLATACGGSVHFPRDNIIVYKYYGDVKAGIIEPAAYASQFALEGTFLLKHYNRDSALRNAYYAVLTDGKTGMFNGMAAHYQRTKVLPPIPEGAEAIQNPFLIIYNDNGRLEGVKFVQSEPAWAKNMKMAMASMLQLDLPNIKTEMPIKPHGFMSKEKTIHGDCWVDYDVHARDQINPGANNEFIITKFTSPMNCTGFSISSFNYDEQENCQTEPEEPVNIASRRVFELEKNGDELLIKKLVAHGGVNYFPWNSRSEAHYVLNNATFAFDRMASVSEIALPSAEFKDMPIIRDLSYKKPEWNHLPNTAKDLTQGRHIILLDANLSKLQRLLRDAAQYLQANHMDPKEPDMIKGQTINEIRHIMSYLGIESLREVFDSLKSSTVPKDQTMKNIFLGVLPQVGTAASSRYTIQLIRLHEVPDLMAITMLAKLPLSMKEPSVTILDDMDDLLKHGDSVPIEVRKASILSFASMIYRVFKDVPKPAGNESFRKYRDHFVQRLISESEYDMKLVYLMALKNVRVGKIYELLAPIIRGDRNISANPLDIRHMAIWAIEKSIEEDYQYAHDLLWPVMADKRLPVKLRIAAYEILMNQAPSMSDVLHMYWFMVYESNQHLYNYHHTNMKGIANSVDPCKMHLREYVRKIMRFTRVHETIHYILASKYSIDYKDEKYNHAEKLDTGVIYNEVTGIPEVLQLEHIVTEGRRPINKFGVRLHIQGCDELVTLIKDGQFKSPGGLTNEKVMDLLKRAAHDLPLPKDLQIDMILMKNSRVLTAGRYKRDTIKKMYDDMKQYFESDDKHDTLNVQHVAYENLYEKHVLSDMGLPVVLATRIPHVASLKVNYNTVKGSQPLMMNFEIDARIWRHGDYSMSIYNPIADVWHAIRRTTATDINLPIRASVSYKSQLNKLQISMPRPSSMDLSTTGMRTHAKDCVTVDEDEKNALNNYCSTCDHEIDVVRDVRQKKSYMIKNDYKSIGLQYAVHIFDCENGLNPVTLSSEWYRALMSIRKNTWNNWIVHGVMATRQQLKNLLISPNMGSCGFLVKLQPSTVYPTSRVDLSLNYNTEDVDHTYPSLHALSGLKYNIRGSLDAISSVTTTSAQLWDMNINVDLSQGHQNNSAKMELTRKTPGEDNLKICVEAFKNYLKMPADPLKLGGAMEITTSKLTILSGYTTNDNCVRDDTRIKVIMVGELSPDQGMQFRQEQSNGKCSNDIKNPLYSNPRNLTPMTLNCVDEMIRHTSLKKYTIDVSHKKVPRYVVDMVMGLEDILRSQVLPNLEYRNSYVQDGNLTIKLEYPVKNELLEVSVRTPSRSYDLIDVNFERDRFNGFGPVIKPAWHWALDNTRLSIKSLYKYTHDKLKLCSIYPRIILTGDGANIPFELSEKWTLITGNHDNVDFAVFAKIVNNNMAVKVFKNSNQVTIIPRADNSIEVQADGQTSHNIEKGVVLPDGNNQLWNIKVTKHNDYIIVQLKDVPLMITHGINHIALAIDTQLQGKISGLCGHLDGTYARNIPRNYTIPDL